MLIASRDLNLRSGDADIIIPIRIFAPEKAENGNWFCRYEIGWPDKASSNQIGGSDSVQALVHALQIIGAEIYSSNYHKSGRLVFDSPGSGYGFPVMSGIRKLLVGDDAKYF
jgi:hypothetical protein